MKIPNFVATAFIFAVSGALILVALSPYATKNARTACQLIEPVNVPIYPEAVPILPSAASQLLGTWVLSDVRGGSNELAKEGMREILGQISMEFTPNEMRVIMQGVHNPNMTVRYTALPLDAHRVLIKSQGAPNTPNFMPNNEDSFVAEFVGGELVLNVPSSSSESLTLHLKRKATR